jgi:hypothetical protein
MGPWLNRAEGQSHPVRMVVGMVPVPGASPTIGELMIIDCDSCTMRDLACGDCIVSFVLDRPAGALVLDLEEARAVQNLQAAGLTPPDRFSPRTGTTGR